jgi:hypothetical protein
VTKPELGFGGAANGGAVNSVTDSRHKRFMDVQANKFAFGVILLELISSRASISKNTTDLVDWVNQPLPKLHCLRHEQTSKALFLVQITNRNFGRVSG